MDSSNNADAEVDAQAKTDDDGYLVFEGPLSELHVEPGRQILLAKIDAAHRGRAAAIAAGTALDQFELFAGAADLALYDRESTYNFACLVGDKLVYGQFSGAQFLKVGNTVKAVVSRRREGYLAHAILDRKQGYLWTSLVEGSCADTKSNRSLAKWSISGTVALLVVFTLLSEGGISREGLEFMLLTISASVALIGLVYLWSNRTSKKLADPATEVFRALGFDHPEDVSFIGFNAYLLDSKERTAMDRADSKFAKTSLEECRDLFNYREAIRKHKVRFVDGNDPHW